MSSPRDLRAGNGPDSADAKSINDMVQKEMGRMNILLSEQQNLRIEVTPIGVRITLLDDPDEPMFERGSARMMPDIENTLLYYVFHL